LHDDEPLTHFRLHFRQRQLMRRFVLDDTARDERARGGLDGLGVALVAYYVVAEQRFEEFSVRDRAGRTGGRRALHVLRCAQLQLELVDDRFQAVWLLVNHVGEFHRDLGKLLLRELRLGFGFELGHDRFERLLFTAAQARQLDDVVAEITLD
jgi:uncharacterized membrane protein